MSNLKFFDFLKTHGTPRTDAADGELALTKTDALKALNLLVDTEIAVLGGDVYVLENDGYFRPTYDNWYCNKEDKTFLEFAKKSRNIALSFLKNYKEGENLKIRYVLVIDRLDNL